MPLYEYQCDACGHRFEVIQKFSDAPIETCPSCGGAVRKLLSSPAIQFKGSGWYITDYARKSGSGGATGKDAGTGSGTSASGESKTSPTEGKSGSDSSSTSNASASTPPAPKAAS